MADGFTTESPEYMAASAYFGQYPTATYVYVAKRGEDETLINAIAAVYNEVGDFWGIFACGITAAEVETVNEYLTGEERGFLYFTVEDAETAKSASGVFQKLFDANARRAAGLVHTNPYAAAAWMGRICGLQHKYGAESSFSACYKDLTGIATVDMSAADVKAIEDINGNVYITRGYSHDVLEHAATGCGLRVDEIMYLDLMKDDLRDAALNMIIKEEGRLAQDDTTSTAFINVLNRVLDSYSTRGILATNTWNGNDVGTITTGTQIPGGYVVYIPSYSTQSIVDREAHKAMPITICVCLAGTVESVEINVSVQR